MAVVSKATLKTYFQDGKEPDENKFIDLIDSLALVTGVPGSFTVGTGFGWRMVIVDGAIGNTCGLQLMKDTKTRWIVQASNEAESGGNVGSNLAIHRFDDSGSWIAKAFGISRETGDAIFFGDLNVGLGLYVGSTVTDVDPDNIVADSDIRAGGDLEAVGDIRTSAWSPYHATSTVTGWSAFTTKKIYYKKVGKLVFVKYWIAGTSNQTYARFTLPYSQVNDIKMDNWSRIQNNGTIAHGLIELQANGNLINAYADAAGNVFIASGTKMIQGIFWFQVV